ncbi:hypothetical protein [Streptomyces sp. 6N223]|uniref:hypothetical protein n=1 Tax=Streptomyces sp. 6N223 TaxID=3457412 RepID=UPI003FD2D501
MSGDEAANTVVDPAVRGSGSARPLQRGIGFLSGSGDDTWVVWDWKSGDEAAAAYVEAAAKLKGGLDVEWDRHRLTLTADVPNRGRTRLAAQPGARRERVLVRKQAVRHAAEFERIKDLTWVEEPVRRWDAEGLAVVQRGISASPRRPCRTTSSASCWTSGRRSASPWTRARSPHHADTAPTPSGPSVRPQRAGPRLQPVADDGWSSRRSRLSVPPSRATHPDSDAPHIASH